MMPVLPLSVLPLVHVVRHYAAAMAAVQRARGLVQVAFRPSQGLFPQTTANSWILASSSPRPGKKSREFSNHIAIVVKLNAKPGAAAHWLAGRSALALGALLLERCGRAGADHTSCIWYSGYVRPAQRHLQACSRSSRWPRPRRSPRLRQSQPRT